MSEAKPPIKTYPNGVRFIGEQDGPFEMELKASLISMFSQRADVRRAYLARVEMDGQGSVALCLSSVQDADREIVSAVAKIFASLFSASESVEVIFVEESREAELMRVCEPFFARSRSA